MLPGARELYARGVAQQRGRSPGYDWEDTSGPSEPEALELPDRRRDPWSDEGGAPTLGDSGSAGVGVSDGAGFGAPRFEYPAEEEAEQTSRRLPAWSLVVIVALLVIALIAAVSLMVSGVLHLTEEDPAPAGAPPPPSAASTPSEGSGQQQSRPGVVTDADGTELRDGTGAYEDPALIGEHTFSWRAWTDGTISVRGLEVDLDATLPGADGTDVVQDGYRLVAVTYEVSYDGPGQLAPVEELWLTGETDRAYVRDIAPGLVPDPMREVPPLEGGESAEFHSVFVVPEADLEGLRLGVETYSGEALYYATR